MPRSRPPALLRRPPRPPPPRRARLGALALLAAACGGSSGTPPTPVPAPVPVDPAAAGERPPSDPAPPVDRPGSGASIAPAATRWRFARTPGAQVTTVRAEADVERLAADGRSEPRPEIERVERGAIVSLILARDATGETAVTGRVDSLVVRAAPRVRPAAPPAGGPGGVRVRGALDARGGARLELDAGIDGRCATPAGAESVVALALARESLPRVPAALAVGTRWRDTTTVADCAGTIPLRVQTSAAYEVLGAPDAAPWQPVGPAGGRDPAGVVRVRRQTTLTVRGQGRAAGRFASVAGSGTGEGILLLDAARGRLLLLDDATETTVALTLAGDPAQRFAQRARTRVVARP